MKRRVYLSLLGGGSVGVLSGCSELPLDSLGGGNLDLGESSEFGDLSITVTDAVTSSTVTIDSNQRSAPSNGVFALFRVEVENTDVTSHEVPVVNPSNYDTMTDQDDAIAVEGINDIQVFGSGEGGHHPEGSGLWGGFSLAVKGRPLNTYPVGRTRYSLGAGKTGSGWTVGKIKSEQTPQLKVQFKGDSAMWSGESAEEAESPTDSPGETISY